MPGSSSPPTLADTREEPAPGDAEGCVWVRVGGARQLLDVRALGEVTVGRSRQASIVADDDRVSRRHLSLSFRDGALWAVDLGSRNGTQLNGKRLQGEAELAPGDQLTIGPVRITVCGPSPRPPVTPALPVLGEGELWQRLSAEVDRANRFQRPLAILGLKLEGPQGARREAAHRVAARLRRIDLLGEYAPSEYLAVLPETRPLEAAALGAELAHLAREVAGVGARVQVASAPHDGTSADALIGAALASPQLLAPAAAPGEARLVAEDAAMRALYETARRAARSELTVLITGETGAGKEMIAAEIHQGSARAHGPYVRLNCAAIPLTLLESELFGHEKGAFTGAERKHLGHIERAHGGTLLFDEVGELPLAVQAKLLRVLEDRKVVRVGGWEEVPVDVRFVAATNRDLEEEVRRGSFREDLFFRLSPITLHVPPLRERPGEIAALAEHFLTQCARAAGRPPMRLGPQVLAALRRYPWPGNLRELRNVIERAVVLADGPVIELEQLPERLHLMVASARPAPTQPMREQLDELERKSLREALAATGGNRTHAARKLGLSRRALLYKLKKYGIE